MKAFEKRIRGGFAAVLSAALIMSGALLTAPTAYAEEGAVTPEVVSTETVSSEAPAEDTPGEEETPAGDESLAEELPVEDEATEDETPAEESAVEPKGDKTSEEAPEVINSEATVPESESTEDTTVEILISEPFGISALSLPPVVPEFGITVSKTVDVEAGEVLTVDGVLPARVTDNGVEKDASVYLMWCVDPGAGKRASGAQCDSGLQQWLSGVVAFPATQNGSVVDGVWSFSTTMAPTDEFGDHVCLADGDVQCGVFVRLAHAFVGVDTSTQFDQFVPVTFEDTSTPPVGVSGGVTSSTESGLSFDFQGRNFTEDQTLNGLTVAIVVAGKSVSIASDVVQYKFVSKASIVGGKFDVALNVPVSNLDRSKDYQILVYPGSNWKTVGETTIIRKNIEINDAAWNNVFPPEASEMGSLKWGVHTPFRNYVEGRIAQGTITTLGSAMKSGDVFEFPQMAGGSWNEEKSIGDVRYAGGVHFSGHDGALSLSVTDPQIKVISARNATLTAKVDGKLVTIADLHLDKAERSEKDGAVTWAGATAVLRAEAVASFRDFYVAGTELDPVTFTVGAAKSIDPTDPVTPDDGDGEESPEPNPAPTPAPAPAPTPVTQGAGSLTWGVSTAFADYVTGPIAKGEVRTSGVGGGRGGYLFPQAEGSSWDAATRTGTVNYSGVVRFTGHNGVLDLTFANPVITVSSPASGTISAGGQTFSLNLIAASFAENTDGSVTYRNVPVSGAISGGDGAGAGGSLGVDSLTFTVGSSSSQNFGSTVTTSPSAQQRTAAATPPATTGIDLVTDPETLVEGGEIEIVASGFEPNETGILVVIYSDPMVLDTNAKADANGVVRWIGKLPAGLNGKHTITLQGSINVGKEITIFTADQLKQKAAAATTKAAPQTEQAAGIAAAPAEGTPAWIWWTAALALLVIAGGSTGLVVAQKRRNGSPTHL